MSESEKATDDSRSVACAKCGHLNPHGKNVCDKCGAHLHVVCHHCGYHNVRARARCIECNHQLHRSWFKRVSQRLSGKRGKISLFQIILLILGIAIGLLAIIYLPQFFEFPKQ
jgi:hypothetical protein